MSERDACPRCHMVYLIPCEDYSPHKEQLIIKDSGILIMLCVYQGLWTVL